MIRLLALLVFILPLAAQEEVVSVEKWRIKEGDNPQWAEPGFDDSDWNASAAPRRHSSAQPFFAGTRWYRAKTHLPASLAGQQLALAMSPLDEVFDVYINGVRIGAHGTWEPYPKAVFPRFQAFRIPENAIHADEVVIAIRRWTGQSRTNVAAFATSGILQFPHAPEIGPAALMFANQELRTASNLNRYLLNLLGIFILFLVGATSLAIYFAQRTSRQNLWLGLALVCEALAPTMGLAITFCNLSLRSPPAAIVTGMQHFSAALFSVFLASICPRLNRPLHWLAAVQTLISALIAASYAAEIPIPYLFQQATLWIAITAAAATAAVLLIEQDGTHSKLLAGAVLLQTATQAWFSLVSLWLGIPDQSRYLYFGVLVLDPRNVTRLVLAITAVWVLYLRHREEQQRQASLGQELAAARLVQKSLLKGTEARTPGLTVEVAYLPASEVGGDFYQELNNDDGSLLVLVGDVSGKGMSAALLVGHISGALSNERSRQPAEVLAHLNDSLVGRTSGGFVTCCCARFDPDGAVILANAGHLPPYAGGVEVEVESGLPLGVVPGVDYSEVRMKLGKAVPFVLISDGVLEAANGNHELFGFDRTREISSQSAQQIADTAKQWGQNDDITVVTVRRAG